MALNQVLTATHIDDGHYYWKCPACRCYHSRESEETKIPRVEITLSCRKMLQKDKHVTYVAVLDTAKRAKDGNKWIRINNDKRMIQLEKM